MNWRNHRVLTCNGSYDSQKKAGGVYESVALDRVWLAATAPTAVDKLHAPAIIPSLYIESDGREHAAQKERGQYACLTLDMDSGNLDMQTVQQALRLFVGDGVAVLVYSSSSATPENRKWRGMVPLDKVVPHAQWEELQLAMFHHVHRATGVKPDYALARAGQLVYLPNVPNDKRAGQGRGQGVPLFYQFDQSGEIGLTGGCGVVRAVVRELREAAAQAEAQQAAVRESAQAAYERRLSVSAGADVGKQSALDMIAGFNAANSIEAMLNSNGYTQRGQSRDWRSPYQSTASFATRDYGTHWVSLSESDRAAGLGRTVSGGVVGHSFGDAFDLWVHFSHGNDVKAALRELGREQREEKKSDMGRFVHQATATEDFAAFIDSRADMAADSEPLQVPDYDADDLASPGMPDDAGWFESVEAEAQWVADDEPVLVAAPPPTGLLPLPAPAALVVPPVAPVAPCKEVVVDVLEKIDSTDDATALMMDLPGWIAAKKGIDDAALEVVRARFRARAKALGMPLTQKAIRELINTEQLQKAAKKQRGAEYQALDGAAQVCSLLTDWVYMEHHDKFFNLIDGREMSTKAFDIAHARLVPVVDGEDKPDTPTRFFSQSQGRTVYHGMYVPSLWQPGPEGQFFVRDGKRYLNLYAGHSAPKPAHDWATRDGWRAVRDHIYKLMDSREDADMLITWMAHNVQFPGVKILWAPVIIGPYGSGKTTIERIMSAAMGQENVGSVSMDEIHSQFSSWAAGKALRFLEELRVVGHSRHDVVNKLKPFLTNERISIVKKGRDGDDVLNTQNYCGFSNFEDAIALDEGDRRYAVWETAPKTREDVLEMFDSEYWRALYDVINESVRDIAGWLHSIDLSGFDRHAAPRMTQAKRRMIEATRPDDEVNIEAILESGCNGVSLNAVSTYHLNDALRSAGYSSLSAKRSGAVLRKMGFVSVGKVVWFGGKAVGMVVRGDFLKDMTPQGHLSAEALSRAKAAMTRPTDAEFR